MAREFYLVISVACLQLHQHAVPYLPVHLYCLRYTARSYSLESESSKDGRRVGVRVYVCWRDTSANVVPSSFLSDGGQIVSGSEDYTVRLWDVQTGFILQVMTGRHDTVEAVAYSPDGILVVSGSFDKTVRMWDVATGEQVGLYTGHSSPALLVAFSEDGQYIVSA